MTNTIGRNIRTTRERLGMEQQELAGKIGLTSASLSNIERGKNLPKTQNLIKIAQALGVTAEELMKGVS
ncbi:MAG: helix-turn-helix domain-containing protein [Oscillospiraceae bacterium]